MTKYKDFVIRSEFPAKPPTRSGDVETEIELNKPLSSHTSSSVVVPRRRSSLRMDMRNVSQLHDSTVQIAVLITDVLVRKVVVSALSTIFVSSTPVYAPQRRSCPNKRTSTTPCPVSVSFPPFCSDDFCKCDYASMMSRTPRSPRPTAWLNTWSRLWASRPARRRSFDSSGRCSRTNAAYVARTLMTSSSSSRPATRWTSTSLHQTRS